MSSHATEGARPSALPSEAPTAEGAPTAPAGADPVEAAPGGAAPTGAAPTGAAPTGAAPPGAAAAEGAQAAASAEQAQAGAAPAEGAPAAAAPADSVPAAAAPAAVEQAADGATTMVLDPEREPDFTEPDFTEPDFAETDSRPVSKLAIVALVTGLVALVPISVASGVASLIGIRRTGRGGHGMAMAGLFLSAAWLIIAAAVGTVGLLTHGFHKPVVVKYREAAVFSLHEGDCVNSPNGQLVSILPCSTPHEAEVFATFALPAAHWPGTAAIASEASSGCGSRLDSYLNPQLAISLSQSFVYPDQVAWTAGTRTVICEVRASSGQLTGSVRGATLTNFYRTPRPRRGVA
jgi:hypothetical protein